MRFVGKEGEHVLATIRKFLLRAKIFPSVEKTKGTERFESDFLPTPSQKYWVHTNNNQQQLFSCLMLSYAEMLMGRGA